MACAAVSAQIPAGWNYNPFLYYPYTAQPAPVQETAEVAAARAAHLAAHISAGGSRVVAVQPVPVWGQPTTGVILDTPEVWAAKVEHYRAHSAAATANGVVSTLPPLQVVNWGVPQPVQDTPEVAAARAAHLAAHAAVARGKRSVQDTPEVMAATIEHYRAYNAAAAANGIMAYLPARYANMPFGIPQQIQETPEVAAARRAHLAAHALAAARVSKVVPPPPVAVANQQLSNSVVVATNGILATLPSFLPVGSWSAPAPAPVQDTPEVHAAKLAFFRAFNEAAVRSG